MYAPAIESLFEGYVQSEAETSVESFYPEKLLQISGKSNKYYSSFQSYNKQFIDGSEGGTIVRWSNSGIEKTTRAVIDLWEAADHNTSATSSATESSIKDKFNNSTALFSWSSSDSYIAARKKELQIQRGDVEQKQKQENPDQTKKPTEAITSDTEVVESSKHIKPKKVSITHKLNRIAESEANRFIHSRIQLIKDHHSDEMNKQIHDRRRKDHEMHLNKLKLKEEEYDRQLQALSLENKSNTGATAFFNNLFGLSNEPGTGSFISSPGESEVDLTINSNNTGSTSASTSKNKRFSFLPSGSMWGSTPKPKDKEELWPVDENGTEEDRAKREGKDDGEATKRDSSIENNDGGESSASHSIQNAQHNSPKHTKTTSKLSSPTNSPLKAIPLKEEADFDDFDEFTTSVPVPVPKVLDFAAPKTPVTVSTFPALKSPTNKSPSYDFNFSAAPIAQPQVRHKFIPLGGPTTKQAHSTGHSASHSINADLLDLFDPPANSAAHAQSKVGSKNTSDTLDLLSL